MVGILEELYRLDHKDHKDTSDPSASSIGKLKNSEGAIWLGWSEEGAVLSSDKVTEV